MKFLYTLLAILLCAGNVFSSENLGEFLIHHVANSTQWSFLGLHLDFTPYAFSFFGLFTIQISLHIIMMIIAFVLLLFFMIRAAKRDSSGVPVSRFGHSIEALVLFIRDDVVIPNIGKKHAKTWVPFVLTIFFFILVLNLLGLIPGMPSATGNINFTAALALIVFVTFNLAGMINNGPFHYIKNLVPHGIPFPILIILFPIELIGIVTKAVALAIRLFANMSAGHFIIFSLLGMIIIFKTVYVAVAFVPFALFITLLEIMVAFLQAYVFALLTSLFIGMSINQDH